MTGPSFTDELGTVFMKIGGTTVLSDSVTPDQAKIKNIKVNVAANQPARLTFDLVAAQQSMPYAYNAEVILWVDGGEHPDGSAQSESEPFFIGYIDEIDPAESLLISYTAYDPIARAGKEVVAMSIADVDANTPGTGATPRVVFNSKIENDVDFAYEREHSATIEDVITTLFADAAPRLNALNIEGISGSTEEMDTEPQEKLVFESDSIPECIDHCLQFEPAFRYVYDPKSKTIDLFDVTQGDTDTLTINQWLENEYRVLSMDINRSTVGRYSAVRIYGPEAIQNRQLSLQEGTLTDISSNETIATYGVDQRVLCKNKYQITDETKRRIPHKLAEFVLAPYRVLQYGSPLTPPYIQTLSVYQDWTDRPTILVKFPASEAGGDDLIPVAPRFIDYNQGIVDFGAACIARFNPNPGSTGGLSDPPYDTPEDVVLICGEFIDPIQVRYPESGHEGTISTEAGINREFVIYDEMLAVGYERGTPVTTATRVAAFTKLANKILNQRKDLVYTGGCTIDGIQWDMRLLNRTYGIAALDNEGNSLTTGWESAKCYLTDVEYDFSNNITTIQFSSDQLALIGIDVDQQRRELGIVALEAVDFTDAILEGRIIEVKSGFGRIVKTIENRITVSRQRVYVNPETGELG